ncbi:MAG: NAD-dependent epimerase/dehydratase family protein, partial [Ilumatobacteraceae bacterium]
MRALVTGGNRYIGLHLLQELVRRGHDVTVVNSHEAEIPAEVRRIHCDRRVPGALTEVLTPMRDDFDIVYDNTAYDVADLRPVVELFTGRVQHLVFTSSSAVYRRSYVQPIAETFRTHGAEDEDPRKAYGVGKVRGEQYLLGEHARTGLPATVLRVAHTLGPMSPLASRDPMFFARLEAGRPILLPGEGFPFVHLVHVADVAALMASIAGNDEAPGQIYNVAGAEITSILGAVQMMARAVGVEPEIVNVPLDLARTLRPPLIHWGEGLVGGMVFSIDKALDHLDWEPQYGVEDGYRHSYEWFLAGGRDH